MRIDRMHGSWTTAMADLRRVGERPGQERTTRNAQVRGYSRALLGPAALLTLGAAAIHYSVAPGHFDEYLPFGTVLSKNGQSLQGSPVHLDSVLGWST